MFATVATISVVTQVEIVKNTSKLPKTKFRKAIRTSDIVIIYISLEPVFAA